LHRNTPLRLVDLESAAGAQAAPTHPVESADVNCLQICLENLKSASLADHLRLMYAARLLRENRRREYEHSVRVACNVPSAFG